MSEESVVAAARPITDRAARVNDLDRVCAADPALRRDVEAPLTADAASNPLNRPPADLARTRTFVSDDGPPPRAADDQVKT